MGSLKLYHRRPHDGSVRRRRGPRRGRYSKARLAPLALSPRQLCSRVRGLTNQKNFYHLPA